MDIVRETMKSSNIRPVVTLLFLAPSIGSLLSGSSPPLQFFYRPNFLFLLALYGGGALIARELRRRWNKSIVSLLLLGAAYGMLQEGLVAGSIFQPGVSEAFQSSLYGRWMGVNWIWTEMLVMYHSVYSVAIPVLLVELAYPESKYEPWFGGSALKVVLALWASFLIIGYYSSSVAYGYVITLPQLIFTLSLTGIFLYLSYRVPRDWPRFGDNFLPSPSIFWMLGAFGSFLFFLGFIFLPSLSSSWVVGVLFGPLLIALFGFLLRRYEWGVEDELHRLYLVGGALTFFMVFSPLLELSGATGMTIVGISTFIGLMLFRRKLKRRIEERIMSEVAEEYPPPEEYEEMEEEYGISRERISSEN